MNRKFLLSLDIDKLDYLSKLLISRQEGTDVGVSFSEEMAYVSYILAEIVKSCANGDCSVVAWHEMTETPPMGEEILIKYNDGKVFTDTTTTGCGYLKWDIVEHDIDKVVSWSLISDIK